MTDAAEAAEREYDRYQRGAEIEEVLVRAEALSLAATYSDDALLHQMIADKIENDEDARAIQTAMHKDLLEGPYPDGSRRVTSDYQKLIDDIAVQRFWNQALDIVRDRYEKR